MLSGGLSRAATASRRFVRGQVRLVRRSVGRFVAMDGFDRSMALAAQAFTALIPLLIIVAAVGEAGDGKALGDRVIERFGLSGSTAASVQRALPSSGTVEDSLSVLSVVILVVSALSFTRALCGQASPATPSPISFAPTTRQSTAMIAALLAAIHSLISSSTCSARAPIAK
jgi:membrane protein